MFWIKHQSRQENLIYLVMWGMLFVAPFLSLYVGMLSGNREEFLLSDILMAWGKFALFLLIFLVHNFLLAPLLVYQHRRTLYFSITAALVAAFTVYQCTTKPDLPHRGPHQERHHPSRFHSSPSEEPEEGHMRDHRPPVIICEHDIVAVVILILMLGMNIGVKGFYRSRKDQQKLVELEKESLVQQLEYLKYQLNPHFLMNTLNNIHALIDIEPPKAQEAIIQLSKILRYVLYESNHERVFISKEIEFMENYVRLMRMRYGDRLTFTVSEPDDGTGVLIPPMLFIAFVENAFKHGVRYQSPSFIRIEGKRYKGRRGEERLRWTCSNSKHPKPDAAAVPRQGGVGLANVRKRLGLIFGSDYSLDVNDGETTFDVTLDIPLD